MFTVKIMSRMRRQNVSIWHFTYVLISFFVKLYFWAFSFPWLLLSHSLNSFLVDNLVRIANFKSSFVCLCVSYRESLNLYYSVWYCTPVCSSSSDNVTPSVCLHCHSDISVTSNKAKSYRCYLSSQGLLGLFTWYLGILKPLYT